jgi:hypothetical protein
MSNSQSSNPKRLFLSRSDGRTSNRFASARTLRRGRGSSAQLSQPLNALRPAKRRQPAGEYDRLWRCSDFHVPAATEAKVRQYSSDRLVERFHELVDRRMLRNLTAPEILELERIEIRLDADENFEEGNVSKRYQDWEQHRDRVLHSIEELIARLRG